MFSIGEEFKKFAVKQRGISSLSLEQYAKFAGAPALGGIAGHAGIRASYSDPLGFTPNIIEERRMNAVAMDVFSRLMADRIIFLGVPVDDQVANIVVAQLLFLESVDKEKDIIMYINSPGGSVYAGLGMYDTMQFVRPDVATICTSLAASMGAVLLCGGAAGKRSALPHARIMIHQPSGGAQGQSSDIEITAKQILILRKELYEIIAQHSGRSFEKIEKDSDRDYWMKAVEAKEYGLIDEVLERQS